jgi:hypothetical protein
MQESVNQKGPPKIFAFPPEIPAAAFALADVTEIL